MVVFENKVGKIRKFDINILLILLVLMILNKKNYHH